MQLSTVVAWEVGGEGHGKQQPWGFKQHSRAAKPCALFVPHEGVGRRAHNFFEVLIEGRSYNRKAVALSAGARLSCRLLERPSLQTTSYHL